MPKEVTKSTDWADDIEKFLNKSLKKHFEIKRKLNQKIVVSENGKVVIKDARGNSK